jgi:hypothetical protein
VKGRHVSEIEISVRNSEELAEEVCNAAEDASSRDRTIWLTDHGQRIAAIVPVDVAEAHEAMIAKVLATKVGPRVQFPDVTVQLSGQDGSTGAIMGSVTEAMAKAGYEERDLRNVREAIMSCGGYQDVLAFVAHTVNVK